MPKDSPPERVSTVIDELSARPKRKRLNALEKKERKAAAVQDYLRKVGRKRQKRAEPNDRTFDSDIHEKVARMNSDAFYQLARNGEDDNA